jgi:hypothetical protein
MAFGSVSERLQNRQDLIWAAEALPNATAKTSDAFRLGCTQDGVVVAVAANTAISIADTKGLKIEVEYSSTEAFTATDGTIVLLDVTASGSAETWAAGDLLGEIAIQEKGLWARVKVTTTADESSEKVDAYLRYLAR